MPSRKRSAPSDVLTALIGRPLAPKQPSTFASESTARPTLTGYQPLSPMVDPSPKLTEPRKKRGRPTKQEAEARRRQVEERQQRRMQAQAAQPMQLGPTAPMGSSYGPQYAPFHDPSLFGAPRRLSNDPISSGSAAQVSVTGIVQTPEKPGGDEPHSSGSSGKRRRVRPPRLSVSDSELPQPPSFPLAAGNQSSIATYDSPYPLGPQSLDRHFVSERGPSETPRASRGESEVIRYDPEEDNRPPNPRSRPWEVTERSEP